MNRHLRRAKTVLGEQAKAYSDALIRLQLRSPTNASFKARMADGEVIAINASNVAVEAGKSRSALYRHHKDVLEKIESSTREVTSERSDGSPTAKYDQLLGERNRLMKERNQLATHNAHLELKLIELEEVLKSERKKAQRANVERFPKARKKPR